MDSKKSFFVAGLVLAILGILYYIGVWIFPVGTLATPGWEGMFPAWVWGLAVIIFAITPFKKIDGRYVFNDSMSSISFGIIALLFILIYLYNVFVFQ
ncbi:MAG: hypothetical protein HYT41_00990 [Candidatus Sungbacteria bacterium]|nr:hypothetical protein [Candidatus Sungbacteria bacterium]